MIIFSTIHAYLYSCFSCFRRKSPCDEKSGDVDANDTKERSTRSLRQRKAANNSIPMKDEKLPSERKNSAHYSPGKFRKVNAHLFSIREL